MTPKLVEGPRREVLRLSEAWLRLAIFGAIRVWHELVALAWRVVIGYEAFEVLSTDCSLVTLWLIGRDKLFDNQ